MEAIFKLLNFLTRKKKNSVFASLCLSSKNNFEDIFNCSGNNLLSFISGLLKKSFKKKVTIYLEFFDKKRLPLYLELVQAVKANNIELILVESHLDKSGAKKFLAYIKKYHFLFKSKIWLTDTGDVYFKGKLKNQKLLDLNYFITCKNDFIPCENYRWNHLDFILTSSLLHSTCVSAQTGVKFDNCKALGFPRNDYLFSNKKKKTILAWLESELGYTPEKIITYAPTYRDYELSANTEKRNLFGYPINNLEKFLKENRFCMVIKLHNLQTKEIISFPQGTVNFKLCYDFSFYDMMAASDCVITDYSSLGYDYLLLDRPIIYNLYDFKQYSEVRGLSYEPYENFCPGIIVKNQREMMNALNELKNNIDSSAEKRRNLLNVFHKYPDGNSENRLIKYFCETYKFN